MPDAWGAGDCGDCGMSGPPGPRKSSMPRILSRFDPDGTTNLVCCARMVRRTSEPSTYWGVTVADALLLPGLGSNWSESETVAVFVCALGEVTVAVIVRVCGVPTVTVPTVQIPVLET